MQSFPLFAIVPPNFATVISIYREGVLFPRVPRGKRGLHIYIDEDLYDRLVNLIGKKFKKLHGALSMECQDALAHWISEHEESLDFHTNSHKLVNPMLPRDHIRAREIISELRNKGLTLQCTRKDLWRSIENTRGSDNRTKIKWTKFVVDHGYMKWISHRILEIV